MGKTKITAEQIEWLKVNYPVRSDHFCRRELHISFKRLWELVESLGLEKEKPTDFEINKKVQVKTKHKRVHVDEGCSKYCMDCIHYVPGGNCERKGKIGALWQKKCFNK